MTGIIPVVHGFVKLYMPRMGYGFVQPTPEEIEAHGLGDKSDILVHRDVVKVFGQPLVCDARIVVGDVLEVPGRGWRATRVISQTLPELYYTGAWFPATGKVIFQEHAYGFVTLDATGQEVLVHNSVFAASIGVPRPRDFKGMKFRVRLLVSGSGLKASHVQARV